MDGDITVNVQIDINEIVGKLTEISAGFNELRSAVTDSQYAILQGFSSWESTFNEKSTEIRSIIETGTKQTEPLLNVLKDNSEIIASQLGNISETISGILNYLSEGKNLEKAANVSSIFNNADDILLRHAKDQKEEGNTKAGKGVRREDTSWSDVFTRQLELPPAGGTTGSTGNKNGGGDSAASGIVGSMLGGAESFLPDAESMEALSQSIGNVAAKLKESAAAWTLQMGAKIADKAVDLQIIALYALDYVKAFGKMVGQIALGTAAWITDTAAKVANTAAQWAQVAATTAWNALCAVATTVTTAFGAAMTFLTSPIFVAVK